MTKKDYELMVKVFKHAQSYCSINDDGYLACLESFIKFAKENNVLFNANLFRRLVIGV